MVYQLIYTSNASPALTAEDVSDIALQSHENNIIFNVTGLLLFSEGTIMQVLEGDAKDVLTLYDNIQKDIRHSGLMVLIERYIERREFPNWAMGYKTLSRLEKKDFIFNLSSASLAKTMPLNPSPILATITQAYARVNRI